MSSSENENPTILEEVLKADNEVEAVLTAPAAAEPVLVTRTGI